MLQRAHRLVGRLAAVYGGLALAALLLLSFAAWPMGVLPLAKALAAEAWHGGFGATVLAPCLMVLTGLAGARWLTAARQRALPAGYAVEAGTIGDPGRVGFAARSGQALAMPAGAGLTALAVWLLWPSRDAVAASANTTLLAAFAFAAAFVSVVSERFLRMVIGPQLVEAPALRRLLLLATALLALAGCLEAARGAGLGWTIWVAAAIAVIPVLVTAEMALRGLARLFLPAPAPAHAAAATDSILAALLTGGPRAPSILIRTHLGLDFARNWALGFVVAAAPPALLLTALLCWGLSGLKLVDQDHRGVYERLGDPVAVLGPGLHLLLPWPLGRLRTVELGAIHTIATGSDAPPEAGDEITADAVTPASADRLWTTAHATEVDYLVASQGGSAQNFQVVSTEILVLYRTGLLDRDALDATYGASSQEAVVRDAAARLATRYFGRRTLDEVMGDQPQSLSEALRRALSAEIVPAHAGIEVLAVVVTEVHPPAAAAAAYHRVQAAEIDALASIANETGRATRMQAVAQQEAHQILASAQAKATEISGTANAAAYRFGADRRASAASPRSFLLERSLMDVGAALTQTPLTLIDHRLLGGQGPTLDLRSLGAVDNLVGVSPTFDSSAPRREKENAAAAGTFSYIPPGTSANTAAPRPDAPQDVP